MTTENKTMLAMRGHADFNKDGSIKSGGEILFYWPASGGCHLILYREWTGRKFQPGEEAQVFWAFDQGW